MKKTTPYARKRANGQGPKRCDGITMARMHNTRLSAPELARIMEPCKLALQAFRQASATHRQWVVLCTASHVATAIEDQGIVRGQRQIIEDAAQALEAIGQRCGEENGWGPTACTGPELSALADLVAAHSRQLHELTYGEYTRAADRAVARVATDGGAVFKMEIAG